MDESPLKLHNVRIIASQAKGETTEFRTTSLSSLYISLDTSLSSECLETRHSCIPIETISDAAGYKQYLSGWVELQ